MPNLHYNTCCHPGSQHTIRAMYLTLSRRQMNGDFGDDNINHGDDNIEHGDDYWGYSDVSFD